MSNSTLHAAARRRGGWARFPVWLLIAMGLVIAVNARFVTLALDTFPGVPAGDDFDTSNAYNRVLSAVDRQNALGWQVRVNDDGAAPLLLLTDRQGQPLAGAQVRATARRPLGADRDTTVAASETAPGRYAVAGTLAQGQWDLLLTIRRGEDEVRITRRVLVR